MDLSPGAEPQARGVVADFTPYVDQYFGNRGGGKNLQFRLVDNAGPDVKKNPGLFWDEQAALMEGYDSSGKVAAGTKPAAPKLNYVLKPADPAEMTALAQADAYNQQNQTQTLMDLSDKAASPVQLYKSLDNPVPGVSDAKRKAFQNGLKQQIAAEASDY